MADELTLKEALYDILHGLQSEKNWRETGEGIQRLRDIGPNVVESLSRGGIAQAIGTSGDLRDIRNTINSYLPKSISNFTTAAEFLTNPYATAIQQTAPTTESTKEFVPRITDTYPGYEQHETLGEYIAPSLGYFGGKALKATKDLPIGASIIGPESKLWKDATEGISLEKQAIKASSMEAKGKLPEEILKETGMVRGLDQQWRSEISDFWSTVKGDKPFGELYAEKSALNPDVRVKDILEHPELFRHYPELGEIQVKPHGADESYRGYYDEDKKLISLKENLTPEEIRSVLHHELTHGTQGIEDWNRGGSAKAMKAWRDNAFKDMMGSVKQKYDDVYKQIEEKRLAGQPYDDLAKDLQNILQEREEILKFGTQDPNELYRRLGGEAEARMVQERLGLTQDQLRQHFPYMEGKYGLDINPDKAIYAGYEPGIINGPAQSAELPKSKQDELGFMSSLENAVHKIGQPKGTGEQFLKQLEKTPGVKTEELEVTGLKKYLQNHPTVTKQEVQDFIEKNRLKLENKILGESSGATAENYRLEGGEVYDDDEYINSMAGDLHYDMKNDPDIFIQEKQALIDRYPDLYEGHETNPYMEARLNQDVEDALWETAKSQASDMYYEDPIHHYYDEHGYDIYGNDNMGYSIKDPNGRFVQGPSNGLYDISDTEAWLRQHHLEEGNIDEYGDGAKYADYVLPGRHENYREVLTTLPTDSHELSREFDELSKYKRENPREWTQHLQRELDLIESKLNTNYESGHFDEPNILAHMRVNDRTINGKKTLMVEEVQSDWHQEGRKKGYASDVQKKLDEIKKQREFLFDEKLKYQKLAEPYVNEGKDAPPDIVEGWTKAANGLQELDKQQSALGRGFVPDAPFKKNWHEMMVKQALDMAAKGDYDAIAFTTGKQQAERYNLAKHVDSLNLIPALSDKDYILQGWKDGNSVVRKEVNKDELADYVGKEVAEKLLASDGGKHGVKELKGEELSVGGQGMKGFYDKIVPDFINKYGKKWGMAMKKANLEHNMSGEEFIDHLHKEGLTVQEFDALPQEKRIEIVKRGGPEVHFVELSDVAKKDIKEKGQPLFAGLGAIAGADYMEGLDEQNKAGIFKDLMKHKKH